MGQSQTKSRTPQPCACMGNAFADLPPEERPQRAARKGSLRKVSCPGCGLIYWTNRQTDLCMDCEKKGSTVSHDAR